MSTLDEIIAPRIARPPPALVDRLCDALTQRFGESVDGFLFYGSCLRSGDALDGVVDLYVLVSDYRRAYPGLGMRLLCRVLPPTVGYIEVPTDSGVVRAKYAVVSRRDFRRGTSRRWFHAYLWGRFAQPCVLARPKDEAVREDVVRCLGTAVETLLGRAAPLVDGQVDAIELWARALGASYATELRPESADRSRAIADADAAHYVALSRAVAAAPGPLRLVQDGDTPVFACEVSRAGRWRGRVAWRLRRVVGKTFHVVRWLKALATFEGGLDYAIWKLERHSGVKVTLTERQRRWPWLYLWGELFRLYRSGALR